MAVALAQQRADFAKELFAELHDSRHKKFYTITQIASKMRVSPRTVERYIYER